MNKSFTFKRLDDKISKSIIDRFPSYNNKLCMNGIRISSVDKESQDTYYSIRPMGKKSIIWFSYYNDSLLTLLKYIDSNTNSNTSTNLSSEFYVLKTNVHNKCDAKSEAIACSTPDNTLYFNNVLLLGYYTGDYFILDNILNYNQYNYFIQTNQYASNFRMKLDLFNTVMDKIFALGNTIDLKIQLPFISDNYSEVFNNIYNIGYKPYGIGVYRDNRSYIYPLSANTDTRSNYKNKHNKEEIFKISADIEQDTYNLYRTDIASKQDVFVGTALIDTYTLSVYMNTYFRNIRENRNLDYIEESETEDDFEDTDVTKYVNLHKSGLFLCKYNDRFKKWTPRFLMNKSHKR